MNLREFVILDVLNIASTIHGHDGVYQATAAEIVEVFRTDPRWEAERRIMGFNARSVGASLGRLRRTRAAWQPPLVQHVGNNGWALTPAGLDVLAA